MTRIAPGIGVLLGVLLLAAASAAAQAPAGEGEPKRAQAVRVAEGSITLDGRLDESAWAAAPVAGAFVQQQPREGSPATHPTDVRFLYDDTYLYIGARLSEDERQRLVVNELRRDFNARDGDLFVVVLDTFHDRLNAYTFQTNPGCALRDSQSYDDGRTNNANWDGVWSCRSTVTDGAWYVEQAIPFKQLRFANAAEQTWGLQMFRLIRHSNEQTMWNPVPRQFTQFKTSYAGVLGGISGVRPGRNIRIKPFATGSAQRRAGTTSRDADGGFDVKIGLGTSLVLDTTYRTDFSQVEADAQQINLTRFSLFFPEKREFFLENQGAFNIGPPASGSSNLVPFFSRTIGLSESGTPIPIVAGGRLTGKVGRNSLAVLNIQTEERANVSVAKYNREFLTNSSVGAFVLAKEGETLSNRVVGTDLRWYPSRRINIDGMFMHSEKTSIGGGNALRLGAQYDAPLTQYVASFTSLDDRFRDDLGFIPRLGVDIVTGSVLRRVRPTAPGGWLRELRPQVAYARYSRPPVGVETETWSPSVTAELFDSSTIDGGVTLNEEVLLSPFRPQGTPAGQSIAAGRHEFAGATLSYSGSNSRRISLNAAWRTGGFYSGNRDGVTAGIRVRVSEKLATTLSASRDVIELANGVSFSTALASVRVDASFSTRMFVNAFVQYNSVTKQVSSNIRYNFIHHPLSDLYLVINDTRDSGSLMPGATRQPESRAVILKFTHLFSF